MGVGSVQAVDVAQQHQQVGLAAAGHNSSQRVIVADGGDLIGGNAIIFIDDGERIQLQQPEERVAEVARMLSGRLDETSLAHAKELLASAH